mmetsp:Transcript_16603/g.30202  ORF Transcript_16603/g.30202 Transcript_16603/m.30202 type:complete len:426 (-) Transcript_16603:47-1324(-)
MKAIAALSCRRNRCGWSGLVTIMILLCALAQTALCFVANNHHHPHSKRTRNIFQQVSEKINVAVQSTKNNHFDASNQEKLVSERDVSFGKEQILHSSGSKLERKISKQLRDTALKYNMIENNDHIMVCVSGGKDSATLLFLLLVLRKKLSAIGVHFDVTAVHLNQMQPGYDNTPLISWLDELGVPYKIVTEDTYSIVKEKTKEGKAYCTLCSRLRRGILYTIAHETSCNKIALGHHGDDAIETLLLNMIHAGQMRAMPARYYSESRDMHVLRPLMGSIESDIQAYAVEMNFPILPCTLCGSQPDLHRGKVKMLVGTLEALNPHVRKSMLTSMENVRPGHLLDQDLRTACGLDAVTGRILDHPKAEMVGYSSDSFEPQNEKEEKTESSLATSNLALLMTEDDAKRTKENNTNDFVPSSPSFIDQLL